VGVKRKKKKKIDLDEVKCEVVDWIQLAQQRGQMRALVNTAMNLLFHKR
jgi:hypothetical protein